MPRLSLLARRIGCAGDLLHWAASILIQRRKCAAAAVLALGLTLAGCGGMFPARAVSPGSASAKTTAQDTFVTPVTPVMRRTPAGTASALPVFLPQAPLLLGVAPATVVRTAPPAAAPAPTPATPPLREPAGQPVAPVNPILGAWPSATPASLPAGAILPAGIFARPVARAAAAATPFPAPGPLQMAEASRVPVAPALAQPAKIWIYASPTTLNYFSALGVNYRDNIVVWEGFLRRHDLPFEVVTTLDGVRRAPADVLLLPSAVALTDSEKQAITSFRSAGGSVLTTWYSGVRDELGAWRGFGFMQGSLGVTVAGNTEADPDDTFLMPHGDNPVTHSLPAGLRVWLERPAEWLPLRLSGAHPAADIMDWSRNARAGKPSSVIAFDEAVTPGGRPSRAVVFGFPERMWLSAQREAIDPIALDALNWLARRPDAYASAWPWPYRGALVLAVDTPDGLNEMDLRTTRLAEQMGGHATYYVTSEHAAGGAAIIKQLQVRGHEIAYLGDRFEGFKDQPASAQERRLDQMMAEMKTAGVEVNAPAGFHPPMDDYDAVTERILRTRGYGHYIAHPGASEARLPFIAPGADKALATVALPRTQSGPDDALAAADAALGEAPAGTPAAIVQATAAAAAAAGLNNFLEEFDRAEKMGGLSVLRLSYQSVLTDAQWQEVSRRAQLNRAVIWTASAGQIANWWRDRERVRVSLDTNVTPPLLTIELSGESPLIQPLSVLVNLPKVGGAVRLIAESARTAAPRLASYDTWRAALVFDNLAPGTHRWFLEFDRPDGRP